MKKLKILLILISLCSLQANAGFNGFTVHSRANCVGFNESISWDFTHEWLLITQSDHYYKGTLQHTLRDEARWTKRSAAFHPTESYDRWNTPWSVFGRHWRHYTDNFYHIEGWEDIDDCSYYNGWWDFEGL